MVTHDELGETCRNLRVEMARRLDEFAEAGEIQPGAAESLSGILEGLSSLEGAIRSCTGKPSASSRVEGLPAEVSWAVVGRLEGLRTHPSQTKLRVGEICGNTVVVGDHYEDGCPGVFFPDGAVLPEKLLEEMWLKGRLAGKKRNRVAVKDWDGVISFGVFYGSRWFERDQGGEVIWKEGPSWDPSWEMGRDVSAELGVLPPTPRPTG